MRYTPLAYHAAEDTNPEEKAPNPQIDPPWVRLQLNTECNPDMIPPERSHAQYLSSL
jgi:hypothetical protein